MNERLPVSASILTFTFLLAGCDDTASRADAGAAPPDDAAIVAPDAGPGRDAGAADAGVPGDVDGGRPVPETFQLYDSLDGRAWERLETSEGICGNGEPYVFYYSPASRPEGRYRLTVFMAGGGSTEVTLDGEVRTATNSVDLIEGRLRPSSATPRSTLLFMDHPANDRFIGPGHFLALSYCTQDRHMGQRRDAQPYELVGTGLPMERQVREALADFTPEQIASRYPELTVTVDATGALESLVMRIVHAGALNVEAARDIVLARILAETPDFLDRAEIIVSGGSAGGYGAWYNFFRFADPLSGRPEARVTMAPMGGLPVGAVWDGESLVTDPDRIAEIRHRFDFYEAPRPCDVAGGAHTPSTDDACDDGLDLLDHYRARYASDDARFVFVLNQMDSIPTGAIVRSEPDPVATLTELCQTVHRYGQRIAERPDARPYFMWTFLQDEGVLTDFFAPWVPDGVDHMVPEHVPFGAPALTPMQSPSGASTPAAHGLLEVINRVATREDEGLDVYVEEMPGVVLDPDDPHSDVIQAPRVREVFPCNVPDPST